MKPDGIDAGHNPYAVEYTDSSRATAECWPSIALCVYVCVRVCVCGMCNTNFSESRFCFSETLSVAQTRMRMQRVSAEEVYWDERRRGLGNGLRRVPDITCISPMGNKKYVIDCRISWNLMSLTGAAGFRLVVAFRRLVINGDGYRFQIQSHPSSV